MRGPVYIIVKLFHSRLQLLSQLCLQQAGPKAVVSSTLSPGWGKSESLEVMGALLAQRLRLICQSAFRGSLDALTTLALGISHCDSLDAEQCISSGNPGTNPAPPPHTTLILAPSLTRGAHSV